MTKTISIKDIFLISLITILFLIAFTGISLAKEETYIKVGLSYGYNEVSDIKISSKDGLAIGEINDRSFNVIEEYPDEGYFNVSIAGGKVIVKSQDGTELYSDFPTNYVIIPYNKGDVIYGGSDGYRGGFCFFPVEARAMNLINFVEVEDYVKGVVHSEIGQGSPLETIKAQAVCARSYALSNLSRHKASGYDICATTHCQVYKGYKNEYPSTNRACEETEGLVIYYKNKVVSTYYSKNDGGFTDNVEDVWGTHEGFLRGIRDEFSPLYKWEKAYTFNELAEILRSKGYAVRNISSIVINKRNASGTVAQITFWDENRQFTLSGDKLQGVLGGNTLKSRMFSFSPITPEEVDKAIKDAKNTYKNEGRVTAMNLVAIRSYNKTIQVMGKDGVVRDREAGDLTITNGETFVMPGDDNGTKEDVFTPIITLGTETQLKSPVTFYGLGWGHGVGMAQDSIIAMGKLGYDYKFMLNYFFTDIKIAPFTL